MGANNGYQFGDDEESDSSSSSGSKQSVIGRKGGGTAGGPQRNEGQKPKIPKNIRECPRCTFVQAKGHKKCQMCDLRFEDQQVFPRNENKTPSQPQIINNGNGKQRKRRRGKTWVCPNPKCGKKNKWAMGNVCTCGQTREVNTNVEWTCSDCTCVNHVNLKKC